MLAAEGACCSWKAIGTAVTRAIETLVPSIAMADVRPREIAGPPVAWQPGARMLICSRGLSTILQ